ncbi:MAG: tRNA (N(6)-L-threonylcarbamoyladenosine(37)-C(2))-methylthiotransferase MtaB [Deltaproteobacteria bacterium]|nr:tRNA (N(6)-L-threonylcarbamoyladenosine(37)-C(2))-methylthiotransferase MtaB [Deltaproteobacteria bacterium]MBW2017722.1 tRNA (N(6)-L-threonylcarbamoyladenosine(37)-C(2))-methylthiotransferase MtaB [Deltaproteobacteria bacterium]MBW2303471.1 tRNA (N(6)-L-threonylcarbamoyladenosine(37)-C(2))-methylthiotransferase MtaB [Deltaproteobacteria bacterium]
MEKTTFRIITLGCKVNQYESAYLREVLLGAGWVEARDREKADVSIVNTCIVTGRAAYQSRQALRKAVRENPGGWAAAVGCYAQVFPEELQEIEGVRLVAGNREKIRLPALLMKSVNSGDRLCLREAFMPEEDFDRLPVSRFMDRTRAFLKVQDGCRSFCSYCIVPYSRGPLRSLEPEDVLTGLRSFAREGYREVVLTGIHLGKYGVDLRPAVDLKGLLKRIGRERLPLRIRLSSLHPDEIDRELIEMAGSEGWLCPHFHISLQSGDDGVLKRMGRQYRARDFSDLVAVIHETIPLAAIGVDLIAGFPGEGPEAFKNTYRLIENLPVSYLHVFPFSARKGTPAADFPDQIRPGDIKERARELRRLGQRKRRAFHQSCIGRILPVLSEGWENEDTGIARGWTDNYVPVRFPSPGEERNRILPVLLEKMTPQGVVGKVIS